jgi:hypothetical protein
MLRLTNRASALYVFGTAAITKSSKSEHSQSKTIAAGMGQIIRFIAECQRFTLLRGCN